jgi:glycolate oxidase iron-sulfur subunit
MIIRALLAGRIDYSEELADRLDKCLLCMTCTVNCPVQTEISTVIVAARADKTKAKGIIFPYNIIYRWLIPRRKLFGNVVRLASWLQRILLPKTEGSIRHLPFFLYALGKRRQIPAIAPKFLRQLVSEVNRPSEEITVKTRVGYLSGCVTDFVFPEVGMKIINFLTKNGVEVVVPKEQGCCGAPLYLGAGDFDTARKLADTNARIFADFDYVISGCATCISASKGYPKFLANTSEREEAYTRFAGKVIDIIQFLVNILQLPSYQPSSEAKGRNITWHDPCHLNRHLKVTDQPRKIINSIADTKYVEMKDADRCCGMAGTFSLYYYELSQRIAAKKIEVIKATEADIVATACPGCQIQLIDNIKRHNLPQKVMHLIELLE